MMSCFSLSFFNAYRTVRGASRVFSTRSLWVIAPPESSISSTVFDDGGNVVEYMLIMLTLLTYEPVGDLNNHFQSSSMLERQERAALGFLLGVLITVIAAHLILGSLGKQPFARPFTNDSTDGELVIAAGTIDRLVITQNGGHMNVYTDSFTIFIPSRVVQELTLQKGDVISVYGVVQTYRGKKEILVSSAQDVSVAPVKTQ